jgi:putative FmdB family regulatory protein
MIYDYQCLSCGHAFDVVKPMTKASRKEKCRKCRKVASRIWSANIQFIGAAVQHAEYNPAFGQVIKNKRHRDEMARRRGMVEIGNEKPATIHKHFDDQRATAKAKRWEQD